jgi:high-affinity nickel-transport protein
METSGMLLLFLLGLRHGFDPDHIAIIDGVGMQYATTKPALAAWTGTLFALGHGLVITALAVTISLFSHSFHLPAYVWHILDWVPGLLLLVVGSVNLYSLLYATSYQPKAVRSLLLPNRLKKSAHPLAVILMGVLFALVFDSTTQVAAWAYTATSQISTTAALLLGVSFSAGMILTDSADSGILFLLMKRTSHHKAAIKYRRSLGWIIAVISLTAGGYKIIKLLAPATQIGENILSMIGLGFFCLMIFFYTVVLLAWKKIKNNNNVH